MEWRQFPIDAFERILQTLEKALIGMTQADLNEQPRPDCNSMGWLAWHLTRTQDRSIADLTGEKQLWIKDNWYARFSRASDAADTGFGHKPEDVAAFKSPDVATVLGYHKAVLQKTKQYLGSLSTTELGRKLDHPRFPTVEARLVATLNDGLQHVGQIAYVRGLLKGKGWMDV
jgi:hypothetical protein